jgi:hypothetical protein
MGMRNHGMNQGQGMGQGRRQGMRQGQGQGLGMRGMNQGQGMGQGRQGQGMWYGNRMGGGHQCPCCQGTFPGRAR